MRLNAIPTEVIITCRECDYFWIQTLGYALANPTAIVRCPRCKAPVTFGEESDPPAIVAKETE